MVDYRRNLPHWFPREASVFITWRLYGSLPAEFLYRSGVSKKISSGEQFKQADAQLDRATTGPMWLKDTRIAAFIVKTLHKGTTELKHYDLHAYVVMANHVHVLITPKVEVRRLTRSLKGVTARFANKILHRTGERFWQDESFDHWGRGAGQFAKIKNYIEQNPIAAGLVKKAHEWTWSSASRSDSS